MKQVSGLPADASRRNQKFQAFADDPGLLSAILDAAGVLLVVLDRDGRIVFFNRGCEEATGFGYEEVVGHAPWERLLIPEEVETVKGWFADLAAGRYPSRHDNFWVTRDGRRRWIRWSNTVLTDTEGRVAWIVGAGMDVTEHHGTEQTLAEVRERAHVILDTTVDGIIVINEQGVMESFNQAAERIFGYTAEEAIGHNVKLLMPSPDHEAHDGYLHHYLETGERRIIGIGREVTGRRKDGSRVPLYLAVGEVHLPGRRLFTGILRDISERKRAEAEARRRLDELAHASRLAAMGQLSSSIAHELNQPLAAMVSFAEACLRLQEAGTATPEVLETALRQIADQGERAGDIVRRLRQFVRKGKVERAPVDVNGTVEEVLGLIGHELKNHDVDMRLDLERDLPPIWADSIQLQQVTLNLVRNAVEALRERDAGARRLAITTARAYPGVIEVSVHDSGRGLPADAAERIFETFYTTKPDGMGMGLSISRSIVEAHGGRLWAETGFEGTTFRFTLPTDAPDFDGG